MHIELLPDSRVLVDLRATGLLRAVGHAPTLVARPERLSLDVGPEPLDFALDLRFRADAIELPSEIGASDREKMRENMISAAVLDAARFPAIQLRGRYAGTLSGGELSGELVVRGVPRRITVPVRVVAEGKRLAATGTWEGKLTELGIKPFRALMGALKLEDWVRLRVEARLEAS